MLFRSTLEELSRLKREGKVRALGASVKAPADALSLLDLFPFQAVQANFNMLDIRALECGLFEKLVAHDTGFIARTPMSFGFLAGNLTGEETFPPEDHRSRWPREQIRIWATGARDLHSCCSENSESPPYLLALRYCLSYPQVSTMIVGMLKAAEVAANVKASDAGPLSDESCVKIEALHKARTFVANRQ